MAMVMMNYIELSKYVEYMEEGYFDPEAVVKVPFMGYKVGDTVEVSEIGRAHV